MGLDDLILYMATSGRFTESEQRARMAVGAHQDGETWRLRTYCTSVSGGSIRVTAASEFCDLNDVDVGDEIIAYLDQQTGALVLLPADSER